VVVSLTVDATGKPQDVRVSRSLAEGVSKKLRSIALSMDENVVKGREGVSLRAGGASRQARAGRYHP
jgi:hypothetical protein